jgi:hypothetical protein
MRFSRGHDRVAGVTYNVGGQWRVKEHCLLFTSGGGLNHYAAQLVAMTILILWNIVLWNE